jgi:hypothetical protein
MRRSIDMLAICPVCRRWVTESWSPNPKWDDRVEKLGLLLVPVIRTEEMESCTDPCPGHRARIQILYPDLKK